MNPLSISYPMGQLLKSSSIVVLVYGLASRSWMIYLIYMAVHLIKLVVGVTDLDHFLEVQRSCVVDYHGTPANAVRTRYKAKRAQEILDSGGSLYRVIKNRIQCRQKILGFEVEETDDKGTQCLIMVEASIIQTISTARRPFQGWRYFEPAAVPRDRGVYVGEGVREEVPSDMEESLREAGLL